MMQHVLEAVAGSLGVAQKYLDEAERFASEIHSRCYVCSDDRRPDGTPIGPPPIGVLAFALAWNGEKSPPNARPLDVERELVLCGAPKCYARWQLWCRERAAKQQADKADRARVPRREVTVGAEI